ncbi:hypothetical protein [Cupriavidus sp. 8B]
MHGALEQHLHRRQRAGIGCHLRGGGPAAAQDVAFSPAGTADAAMEVLARVALSAREMRRCVAVHAVLTGCAYT